MVTLRDWRSGVELIGYEGYFVSYGGGKAMVMRTWMDGEERAFQAIRTFIT